MPESFDLSTPLTSVAGVVAQAATWTNAARADWPRYGYPGPAYQWQLDGNVTYMSWFLDNPLGVGKNHLVMIPVSGSNTAGAWGVLQYPLNCLSLQQNWEMAAEIYLGPAGFAQKPEAIVFGLGRYPWPGFPLEFPSSFATQYRNDSFIACEFYPVAGTGVTNGNARVRYRLPNSSSIVTHDTQTNASAADLQWVLNADRKFRVSYNASTRVISMVQMDTTYASIDAAFTAQNITDLCTTNFGSNPCGEWAFPWIGVSVPNSASGTQCVILKQFFAWGTAGNLKMPRGGVPFSGAGQAADDSLTYGAIPGVEVAQNVVPTVINSGVVETVGVPMPVLVQPGLQSGQNIIVTAGQLYPRGYGN